MIEFLQEIGTPLFFGDKRHNVYGVNLNVFDAESLVVTNFTTNDQIHNLDKNLNYD